MEYINIRIDTETRDRLRKLAAPIGLSMAGTVRALSHATIDSLLGAIGRMAKEEQGGDTAQQLLKDGTR